MEMHLLNEDIVPVLSLIAGETETSLNFDIM